MTRLQWMGVAVALALGSWGTTAAFSQEAGEARPPSALFDLSTRGQLDVATLGEQLARQDVVFLGEEHDNDAGHELQLAIVRDLVERGVAVTVSVEMFERDVQGAVDDYLAGRIDEEAFLKAARPWPNYAKHYRPIIELAKERRLPVLAANAPRNLASQASKGEAFAPAASRWLPRQTTADPDAYWDLFRKTMQGHMGADGGEAMQRMFAAQCLKDDAMAEAIADHLESIRHRPVVVVHLCGKFHSDYGWGTVQRLLTRRPLTRTAVVTMEKVDDLEKIDFAALRDRGHYLMAVPANAKPAETAQTSDSANR